MPTLYWPFPTSKVSEWPGQRPSSYHVGTDFGIPQGTPLRATIDGVITRHNSDGLGAYVLDIMSDDGLLVRNGHLSRMDVNTGQRVKAGDIIGLTGGIPGTPGAGMSTGAHLHWELRRDRAWSGGNWIDPRNLNPQPSTFGQAPTTLGDEADMRVVMSTDGRGWLVTANKLVWVNSAPEFEILKRICASSPTQPDVFISNQLDAVAKYFTEAPTSVGNVSVKVDAGEIAKAVNDEMSKRMQS